MALPSSGVITLQDIQAEFGGPTNPISLQNYYRGGGLVPNISANSAIPTSGVIGLQNFYGAANILLSASLTSDSWSDGDPKFPTSYKGYAISSLPISQGSNRGALSPNTLSGQQIQGIVMSNNLVDGRSLFVYVAGSQSQNFFNSVTVPGAGTFLTSASSHIAGSVTIWRWGGLDPSDFTDFGSGTVTFT